MTTRNRQGGAAIRRRLTMKRRAQIKAMTFEYSMEESLDLSGQLIEEHNGLPVVEEWVVNIVDEARTWVARAAVVRARFGAIDNLVRAVAPEGGGLSLTMSALLTGGDYRVHSTPQPRLRIDEYAPGSVLILDRFLLADDWAGYGLEALFAGTILDRLADYSDGPVIFARRQVRANVQEFRPTVSAEHALASLSFDHYRHGVWVALDRGALHHAVQLQRIKFSVAEMGAEDMYAPGGQIYPTFREPPDEE